MADRCCCVCFPNAPFSDFTRRQLQRFSSCSFVAAAAKSKNRAATCDECTWVLVNAADSEACRLVNEHTVTSRSHPSIQQLYPGCPIVRAGLHPQPVASLLQAHTQRDRRLSTLKTVTVSSLGVHAHSTQRGPGIRNRTRNLPALIQGSKMCIFPNNYPMHPPVYSIQLQSVSQNSKPFTLPPVSSCRTWA